MDNKLNNLINFKEFGQLDKLQNTPGKKVVEGFNNIHSFDKYDESWDDVKNFGRKIGTASGIISRTSEEIAIKAQQILNNDKRMNKIINAIDDSSFPKFKDDFDELDREGGDIFNKYILYLDDNYEKINDDIPFYQPFDVKTGEIGDTGVYGKSHTL
jgi:hypothetical protein